MATSQQIDTLIAEIRAAANRPIKVLGIAVSWVRVTGNPLERSIAEAVDKAIAETIKEPTP